MRQNSNVRGYAVTRQTGVEGFRIDPAARHPADPDRANGGLGSDGVPLQCCLTICHHDMIRQQRAKALGRLVWRWATDWCNDPEDDPTSLSYVRLTIV